MSELGPEASFSELRAQLEPDINETIARLAIAYDELHNMAHKVFTSHSPDETIWVTEYGPHLKGSTQYRSGMTFTDAGEFCLMPPLFSMRKVYHAWLQPHPDYFSADDRALTDGLIIATSLEEFSRQIKNNRAWSQVKTSKKI